MKMCAECKALYPDETPLEFCVGPEMGLLSDKLKCGGSLKTVQCLLCEDTGKVPATDPQTGRRGYHKCPRGCGRGLL